MKGGAMAVKIIADVVYARLDFPDAGTFGEKSRAKECLFQHILYPVEHIKWDDTEYATAGKENDTIAPADTKSKAKRQVALKNIKYWWPVKMFTFMDVDGKACDIEKVLTI